jgi:ABC-type multidrug transport system fused ATPase/permease subunit
VFEKLPTVENIDELWDQFYLIAAFAGAEFLLNFLQGILLDTSAQALTRNLRKTLFQAIMAQEYAFFEMNGTGQLLNRLAIDAESINDILAMSLSTASIATAKLVTGSVLLFVISWKLSLVFFGVLPPMALLAFLYGRFARKYIVRVSRFLFFCF